MAEVIICGVCNQDSSKYKCPHCELRYCSIPCFKEHIAEHETNDKAKDNNDATSEAHPLDPSVEPASEDTVIPSDPIPPQPQPQPQHTSQQTPISLLLNDPRFPHLLTKHPALKPALRRIYRATLHPETQLDTHHEVADAHEARNNEDVEAALARKWGGSDMRRWTREKADEAAVKMLRDLRGREEGVAEFVELVRIVLGGGDDGGLDGNGQGVNRADVGNPQSNGDFAV